MKSRLEMLESSIEEIEKDMISIFPNFQAEFVEAHLNEVKEKQTELIPRLENIKEVIDSAGLIEEQAVNNEVRKTEASAAIHDLETDYKDANERFIEKRTELQRLTNHIPEALRSKEGFEIKWKEQRILQQGLEQALEQARKKMQSLKEQYSGIISRREQLDELVKES